MALEAIKDIRQTEEKAEETIRLAREQAKDIIKNAGIKAKEKYDEIILSGKNDVKVIIESKEEEGIKQSSPILGKGNVEKEDILNLNEEKLQKAVNLVVERIVNINGNS